MSDSSIIERIQIDLVAAMKGRDADTTSTLRMLKAALMEAKTRKPKDEVLGPDEELAVLRRYVKQRREAVESMKAAGDPARAEREQSEIAITERYMPAAMSESDLAAIVAEVMAAAGATGPKDTGRVIGAVMARVKGLADGNAVSRLVKEKLGA